MTISRILARTAILSGLAMVVFLYLFVDRNAPGLVYPGLVSGLAVAYGIMYLYLAARLARAFGKPAVDANRPRTLFLDRVLPGLACGLLLFVFFDSTVTDYYQPLSLFDDVIAALAAWWGLLITVTSVLLFSHTATWYKPRRAALPLLLWALFAWPLAASLYWLNAPSPAPGVDFHRHVFIGGEYGYDVYRIPGLVQIPAGSEMADGRVLEQERLLAFAEARRDGHLDTGVIDLVVKTSDDLGRTWSEQRVVCRNEQDGKRGKCGNPTPVFDAEGGTVFLAYNLSGTGNGLRHHSSHLMASPDGGLNWRKPVLIGEDNFVFGPGKGLQKAREPNLGRLLLPGYAGRTVNVLYSDDKGRTWEFGEGLAGGNESDLAERSDGSLYLASRHIAPVARPPEPNGRLYSISADGGTSWSAWNLDTALATPVCQASVLSNADGEILLFSNPGHPKARVNLGVRYSPDGGTTWPGTIPVYLGPAGYSVMAPSDGGDVLLLYENGNMAYSERISLARFRAE